MEIQALQSLLSTHKDVIVNAVLDAGALIEGYAADTPWDGDITKKTDGTPVTVVDREAEDIVVAALQLAAPDIPVVAEERCADGDIPSLAGQNVFWLVDALDGTKEFIAGTGEYTVNVALIHDGVPVYGLIYAPAKAAFYEGGFGQGAKKYGVENFAVLHDGAMIKCAPLQAELVLVTSSRQQTSSKLKTLFGRYKISERKACGSSLKFAMIAEGRADIYPRLGYTSEWDTAAGDAILREAGGAVIDTIAGVPMTYGHVTRKFLNPHFVALPYALYQEYPEYFKE